MTASTPEDYPDDPTEVDRPGAPHPQLDIIESLQRRPEIYPDRGWLARYIDYAEELTDAPPIYHLACGLAIVQAALGNRTFLTLYGGKVFPNTWNVLLGASSYMRKSTSIRISKSTLDREEKQALSRQTTMPQPSARRVRTSAVLPEPGSREGFAGALSDRADGILIAMEFGELLANLARDYMSGTKEALTAWYDGDTAARITVSKGSREVVDPAITILAASTPDWLEDRAKEGDIRSGFLARFLWWPAAMAEKNPWMDPMENRHDDRAAISLANDLNQLRRFRGEVTLTEAARATYREWLRDHEESYMREGFPQQLMGFHARLPTAVLKIAMALQACLGAPWAEVVDELAVTQAIRIGSWQKVRIAGLFLEELAFTPFAAKARRFLALVPINGSPVLRSSVVRALKWTKRELNDVVEVLTEGGQLESCRVRQEGKPGDLPAFRRLI